MFRTRAELSLVSFSGCEPSCSCSLHWLCLCLVLVPKVEVQLLNVVVTSGRYRKQSRDVHLVHAVVVWLCLLCVYIVTVHIARKRVHSVTRCKLHFKLFLPARLLQ